MLKTRRTFKYRLYPNRQQRERLHATLEVCRQLYNDALQERREAWKLCHQSVTFAMQSAQLPTCKKVDPSLCRVYSQVLQDVLHCVDKTYQAFFRRGHGFPRFKGAGWFDSFTYPQLGFSLQGSQLALARIGNLKIKLHRPLGGKVRTLTLKRENGKWYACFSCLVEAEPLLDCSAAVGIDLGLESFATTSDGENVENLRWFRQAQKKLRRQQRHLSRCRKRSGGWRRACRAVAQLNKRVASLNLKSVRTSFRSHWQNGVAERWVGSCRRDLLDHVIPLGERHLKRLLAEYVRYFHQDRTHLGLQKDTPYPRRPAEPREKSTILSFPRLGGLHHRYNVAA